MIPYSLRQNNLTPDPTDYSATVETHSSIDFERIADRIVEQGSTVTRADVLAVLNDTVTVCERYLLDGHRVVLGGLVQLFPRIRGVFNTVEDGYDPARHMLDVGANPGQQVRDTIRNAGQVQKIEAQPVIPSLKQFTDVASGQIDDTVTVGDIGRVSGNRLKFSAEAIDEGVFFIATADATETKVSSVSDNLPSKLTFLIPALTPGTYWLEVRTRLNGASSIRSGRLPEPLTVENG